MKITLRAFASIRDIIDADEVPMELEQGATLGDALELASASFPALKGRLDGCRFACNTKFSDRAHSLKDGDEVAIIPPVSGG